jgi:predicted esterase
MAAVALLLSACTSGEPTVSPASSSGGSASPSGATPGESAVASIVPAMTFDPAQLGAPGPAPNVGVVNRTTAGGVTTEDVTFARDGVTSTQAYLVHPASAGKRPAPAVLWFHWLETGAPTSNRTEFLDEARGLAADGVVSLLVQGTFPWLDRPSSLDHDLGAVESDVRMLRAGLDLLVARSDVDPARIALVGHDFGAMYASVVFGSDARVAALVVMAPTARWGDWFLRYWAVSGSHDAYSAAMAPLDPVTWLGRASGRPVLLQFAAHDPYVPAAVAAALSDAAGASGETRAYDAGHQLDAAAAADRDAWLKAHLGLG